MRYLLFSALFTLVSAHALHGRHNHNHVHRRQAPPSLTAGTTTSSLAVPSASSSVPVPPPPPPPAPTGTTPSVVPLPAPTTTPASSVPAPAPSSPAGSPPTTAVPPAPTAPTAPAITTTPTGPGTDIPPLASITSGEPPEATASLTTTYSPGASPTYLSGAPPLPSLSLIPSDWPTMDKTPPTDSDEVKQWLTELNGFNIPDIRPTINGSCLDDPEAAANAANNGWWTCGGYTRPTDVVACPSKYTWGLSFDDGPASYTPKLLNFLAQKDILATFYTVGSRVLEYPLTLQEEYMAGHEISVHTWSHSYLTTLTNEQIVAELGWTRKVIQSVIGVTPTSMRPPYGDIDDRVRAISLAMGLEPAIWTRGPTGEQFDTKDWEIPAGQATGESSFEAFQYILGNASLIDTGFIVLEHDLFQATVDMAIGYTLPAALNYTPSMTLQPIGKCNGRPAENQYLETTTNTTFPYLNSSTSGVASTTASAREHAASQAAGSDGVPSSGALRAYGNDFLGSAVIAAAAILGVALVSY